MAVIGATQLEPVNILGSYVQGLEASRQARAQRMQEEALLGQTQRETALRNFLSSADLSKPDVRNELLRFGKPGAELAASIEDIADKRATAEKTGLDIKAAEMKMADDNYGRFQKMLGDFAYGKTAPTKDRVIDELDFLIAQGVVAPEFKQFAASTLPDDPAQLQTTLRSQFLSQIPPAERAKLFVPKSQEVFAQDVAERAAGAPQTSILNKGDTAEEVEKAKSRVKEYDTIRDRAVQGRRTLPSLQRAASALEKFETGFGAEATTEARRVLVSLGLADDEAAQKVQSADSFAVAVKDRILFKLSQQAGTQTEGDAQRAEDTWASYRKLTDSNKFLIDLEKAVIAQDNEELKFYDDWEAKNGTYRGAAQAWRDGPGSKSLFDRPEMKKYAEKNQGTPKPPDGFVINPPR
jgi:hypothetical protein